MRDGDPEKFLSPPAVLESLEGMMKIGSIAVSIIVIIIVWSLQLFMGASDDAGPLLLAIVQVNLDNETKK